MHEISLDDLTLVNQIAKHGSFAGAAEHLGLPRPNVTRRIKQLEAFMGVVLFKRSTRNVSLTPEGEAFLGQSEPITQLWTAALEQAKSATTIPSGELRIKALGLFNRVMAGPHLVDFMKRYPQITLQMRSTWLSPDVTKFDADLMFNITPLEDKSFVSEPLSVARRCFYASPAYLARSGVPAHPRDLPQFNLITLHYPRLKDWIWEEGSQRYELDVQTRLVLDEVEAALNMTLLDQGITNLPEFICREHVRRGELVQLFGGQYSTEETLWAIYPRASYTPVRLRLFIDWVRDSALFGRPAA